MKKEKKKKQGEIDTLIACGILIGMMILVIYIGSYDLYPERQGVDEFCEESGYPKVMPKNSDEGFCRYNHQDIFNVPDNQYYKWDGTKWGFASPR